LRGLALDDLSRANAPRDPATATQPVPDVPEDQYAAIVKFSDDAILSKDRDGIITTWNPAAERMYGYTAEEAIGEPISILIPSDRSGEERRILAEVLAGDRIDHYETERVTKDGRRIVVSLTISPVRNPQGEITSASVIARDVTERERTLQLTRRLQAITSSLASELTATGVTAVLLEGVIEALHADAGTLGLLDSENGEIVLAGSRGYSESGMQAWQRFALDADVPMSAAVRTGEPVWTSSAEELQRRFSGLAGARVPFAALAVVPLISAGNVFGAIALSFAAEREFDVHERAFLRAVVHQGAQTLERARLYEAQRLATERLRLLAEAGEVLADPLDLEEALGRLADLSVQRIADWCAVDLLTEEGELRSVVVAHTDPERARMARELRDRYPADLDSPTGVARVIRTGEPELYPELDDELLSRAARDAEHLRILRELAVTSAMVVPLAARGQPLGALTLVSSSPERRFGEEDLQLASDLARRAGLAIDNSLRYRREHEAAVTLQRSLLPQTLPQIDRLELAARYDPAAPGLEVGGDWYEVVERDDGSIAVIIGDVAGRGIRAAAVMGRLRSTLRAYVTDGYTPAEAMDRLDRQMKEAEEPQMATAFQLHYDPATGLADYVRAGHPPALLRLPDATVTELGGTGTPPLGIIEGFRAQPHRIGIPPGSLLLLYTDGLIERRGADLARELARLKGQFANAPAEAQGCLDHLAELFSADTIPDDVAMLAVATRN
jgi:PAS domain S-box-containing protein